MKMGFPLLNIELITEYPIWLLVFCLLLGVAYAGVLYYNERRFQEIPKFVQAIMATLRLVLISCLSFLLLSPFLKSIFNEVEKPVIIIAQDNSASIILNKDSSFYVGEYLQNLAALKAGLVEKYEVRSFVFGQELQENDKVQYNEKSTNISNLLEQLNTKFYNRNIGAIVLASDGIFNEGYNPVYMPAEMDAPIFTVSMGDTSEQRDIILKEVLLNKITFLGNKFPLEIFGITQQCAGQQTELTVMDKEKVVFSKTYALSSNKTNINEKLLLDADAVGVKHYRVILTHVDGEISRVNNIKDVYIDVLDGRQHVLILAHSPHPDIKAIAQSIESNNNYEVTTKYWHEFNGKTDPYNLIIMHQLSREMKPKLELIAATKVPLWIILGNQSYIPLFNNQNFGVTIDKSNQKFNNILNKQVYDFPLFAVSDKVKSMLQTAPPAVGPFGSYKLTKNGYRLLNQKIGSVETNNPLFVFFQDGEKKRAFLFGEGIWKWKMQEFLTHKHHDGFNELVNKSVQFLSVKEDKSKFRVLAKTTYLENQEILLNAELYNGNYELVNEPEITISFVDETGHRYDFEFNRSSTSYLLNAGVLPVGFYTYKAKVNLGGKLYEEVGKFQVNPILLEANHTIANHQVLRNMATKTGGKLVAARDLKSLRQLILSNQNIVPTIYEEHRLREMIELKWIFYLFLGLLSLEWFLRKRNGAY